MCNIAFDDDNTAAFVRAHTTCLGFVHASALASVEVIEFKKQVVGGKLTANFCPANFSLHVCIGS